MDIVFEDNHILIVNKRAGLLTQASGTSEINLEDEAKAWIKAKYAKPGNVFLHAVHRLDRAASGIVLFARTSKGLSRLNASMRARATRKIYFAASNRSPALKKGTLEHYLLHGSHRAELASKTTPGAVLARLHYEVVAEDEGLTLFKIELETGRYHQIRAQLAALGCPILGDERYGGSPWKHTGQIALHHAQLEIPHPITQKTVKATASFPSYWPLLPPALCT